jgi:hypothetical protein
MNMENKYFTPDIEDFYVGYEFETKVYGEDDTWVKCIYSKPTDELFCKDSDGNIWVNDSLRVPYLTKEQIEAEGWEYKHTHKDLIYYDERIFFEKRKSNKKEDIWTLQLEYYKNNLVRIQIDQGHDWKRFLGECKDINTFRKIIKLLKIN